MAKLDAQPGDVKRAMVMRVRRRIRVSGENGQVILQKWPAPRGKPKSPLQQAWVNRFSQMACFSSNIDPAARRYGDEVSKGTLWFWRDVATKAMLGQYLSQKGETRVTTPTAMIHRSASQSILNNTVTTVTYDALDWDNNNFWNAVSKPNFLTIRSAGLYFVGIEVKFAVGTTGRREVALARNGSEIARQTGNPVTTTSSDIQVLQLIYCHAGDVITAVVRHTQGATLGITVPSFFALGMTPEAIVP